MPIFQYTGYRPDGSSTEGTIEAEGLQAAVSGVKALGVYPKDVTEYSHKEKAIHFFFVSDAFIHYICSES